MAEKTTISPLRLCLIDDITIRRLWLETVVARVKDIGKRVGPCDRLKAVKPLGPGQPLRATQGRGFGNVAGGECDGVEGE
jgi:hypothetical protein